MRCLLRNHDTEFYRKLFMDIFHAHPEPYSTSFYWQAFLDWLVNLIFFLYSSIQFSIIEFDPETFRILLDYLHTGSCPLTCASIPGLICAAEHYDLPELLQACFHHAKQFLRIEVVSKITFSPNLIYNLICLMGLFGISVNISLSSTPRTIKLLCLTLLLTLMTL